MVCYRGCWEGAVPRRCLPDHVQTVVWGRLVKEGHDNCPISLAYSTVISPHTPEGLRQTPHWGDVYHAFLTMLIAHPW